MQKPFNPVIIAALVLMALSSIIGINQYHYGMWNQYIALPWLYDFINPELYPHDPLIDQRESSPSFYNMLLAGLAGIFKGNLAWLHFSLYCLALFFSLVSVYRLSWQIFKNAGAGLLAVVMFVFAFPVIGDIATLESLLMERTLSFPILIFSLVFVLKRRWLWVVILQAFAFNLHPLSGLYFISCTWLGVVFWLGLKEKYFLYWPLLLLLLFPVLYLRYLHPSDSSAIEVSEMWMKLMYLRNAHHSFPSTFSFNNFLRAGLILVASLGLIWGSSLVKDIKKLLMGFSLGIVIFLIIGTVFTEIIPIRIIIQLQFFRAFVFLTILCLILWSGLIIQKPDPVVWLIGIGVLSQYFYGTLSKSIAFLIVAALAYLIIKRTLPFERLKPLMIACLVLSVGVLGLLQRGGIRVTQGWQPKSWYSVQNWARNNSATDALFIVPPAMPGFRVQSQRTSYGNWHDGTKVFFSEAYGELWWGRMQALQCTDPETLKKSYQQNRSEDFIRVSQGLRTLHSEAYVICYHDMNLDELELAYQNDDYKIYRFKPI